MKRSEVLDLYNKIVRRNYKIIKVKNSTMSDQLAEIGKKIFPKKFKGVYSINTIPKNLPNGSYFITNNKKSSDPGEHWLAGVVLNKNKLAIYDSFGRPSKDLIPSLTQKGSGWKIVDSHYSNEQGGFGTKSCGLRSISFLSVVDEIGIKNALKI